MEVVPPRSLQWGSATLLFTFDREWLRMFWDEPDDGDSFGVPEELVSEAVFNSEIEEVLSQHRMGREDLAALADRMEMTAIPERN